MMVLHSIPPDAAAGLLDPLRGNAARVAYLSSTAEHGVSSRELWQRAEPNRPRRDAPYPQKIQASPWIALESIDDLIRGVCAHD